MQQRMYLPAYGRFASPDPAYDQDKDNPTAAWNLYIYCYNNPVTRVDPNGEEPLPDIIEQIYTRPSIWVGPGHHVFPWDSIKGTVNNGGVSAEAFNTLNDMKITGPGYKDFHGFHPKYNPVATNEWTTFLKDTKIDPKVMTAEQARIFGKSLENSFEPEIARVNQGILRGTAVEETATSIEGSSTSLSSGAIALSIMPYLHVVLSEMGGNGWQTQADELYRKYYRPLEQKKLWETIQKEHPEQIKSGNVTYDEKKGVEWNM